MATPEPYAVGKYLASVIPETWTKSIPACLAMSVKRNGLTGTAWVQFARTGATSSRGGTKIGAVPLGASAGRDRRPRWIMAIATRIARHISAGRSHEEPGEEGDGSGPRPGAVGVVFLSVAE